MYTKSKHLFDSLPYGISGYVLQTVDFQGFVFAGGGGVAESMRIYRDLRAENMKSPCLNFSERRCNREPSAGCQHKGAALIILESHAAALGRGPLSRLQRASSRSMGKRAQPKDEGPSWTLRQLRALKTSGDFRD